SVTPSPTGTPSVTPDATDTPSLTPSPTGTGTDTPTPTIPATPTMTASATSSPAFFLTPDGISMYIGGTDQSQTFYLPVVRSDPGYETVIHLSNGSGVTSSASVTFYDSTGSVTTVITSSLNGYA